MSGRRTIRRASRQAQTRIRKMLDFGPLLAAPFAPSDETLAAGEALTDAFRLEHMPSLVLAELDPEAQTVTVVVEFDGVAFESIGRHVETTEDLRLAMAEMETQFSPAILAAARDRLHDYRTPTPTNVHWRGRPLPKTHTDRGPWGAP